MSAQLRRDWEADQDKRRKMLEDLKAFAAAPPPSMLWTREDIAAAGVALDRTIAQNKRVLYAEDIKQLKDWETRVYLDPLLRPAYGRAHPGGERACMCELHRYQRGEDA